MVLRVQRYELFSNPPNFFRTFFTFSSFEADLSDNHPRFMVVFAEFGRTTALTFPADAVEVAKVVEATMVTDLGDGVRTVDKQSASMPQTQIDDIVAEVATRMEFEEPAERGIAHAGNVGNGRKTDFLAVMTIDISLHLLHTAAVAR